MLVITAVSVAAWGLYQNTVVAVTWDFFTSHKVLFCRPFCILVYKQLQQVIWVHRGLLLLFCILYSLHMASGLWQQVYSMVYWGTAQCCCYTADQNGYFVKEFVQQMGINVSVVGLIGYVSSR